MFCSAASLDFVQSFQCAIMNRVEFRGFSMDWAVYLALALFGFLPLAILLAAIFADRLARPASEPGPDCMGSQDIDQRMIRGQE